VIEVKNSLEPIRVERIEGRVLNRIFLGVVTLLVTVGVVGHISVTATEAVLRCGLSGLSKLSETLQSTAARAQASPHSPSVFRSALSNIQDKVVVPLSWRGQGRWLTVAEGSGLGYIRPSKVYDTAYQDFVKGRYELAIQQFEKFVKDFPTNSRAPQAYYFLGECYYNLGNLKLAAQNLSLIITRHKENVPNYQNSRQVPPALFRLGGVYEEAGKLEKAKAFWGILLIDYPNTSEAHLARKRLKRLP